MVQTKDDQEDARTKEIEKRLTPKTGLGGEAEGAGFVPPATQKTTAQKTTAQKTTYGGEVEGAGFVPPAAPPQPGSTKAQTTQPAAPAAPAAAPAQPAAWGNAYGRGTGEVRVVYDEKTGATYIFDENGKLVYWDKPQASAGANGTTWQAPESEKVDWGSTAKPPTKDEGPAPPPQVPPPQPEPPPPVEDIVPPPSGPGGFQERTTLPTISDPEELYRLYSEIAGPEHGIDQSFFRSPHWEAIRSGNVPKWMTADPIWRLFLKRIGIAPESKGLNPREEAINEMLASL